ncbi:MAG: hypothetical protein N4A33_12115 [Bacteriovoracaceae bacterium]|jgi:hypothetical protein|nr:hypothetical protein [Bacteriovoracaceae bacterium]
MEEIIESILEKSTFSKKEIFKKILNKSLHYYNDSTKESYSEHKSIMFRFSILFKEFSSLINEKGKNKQYEAGVEALRIICDEIAIDLEDSELFILFHLRNLGKFRKKETDLKDELDKLWKTYPHYELSSSDFSYTLKNLMRAKFITYRRGNLYLNQSVLVRYRVTGV